MRTVITGGAGFIGSHLCRRYLDEGHDVVCVDNFLTGKESNIEPLLANEHFELTRHDVSEPLNLDGPIDNILHFACPASPVHYLRHPLAALKVGSFGTYYTLELAKAKGARYLLASTSEIYGDSLVHPQSENYWGNVNSIGVRAVYDESKRFAEAMVMTYLREFALDTRICRIFNTFGPRMTAGDGRVVPNFICQALRGEPLTVYGDGRQTRSLCYVDDTVDGVFRLLDSSFHEPVNLGNPSEITMLDLATEILQLTDCKSELEFRPLPDDDPKIRCPDITRAQEVLGWRPKISRLEGLAKTIAYFRRELGANGQ